MDLYFSLRLDQFDDPHGGRTLDIVMLKSGEDGQEEEVSRIELTQDHILFLLNGVR